MHQVPSYPISDAHASDFFLYIFFILKELKSFPLIKKLAVLMCGSGINHGSNSSINVIYSGTMSAAIEAGIEGVPAIGFSLLDYKWNANFDESKDFIKKITLSALKNGMHDQKGKSINYNMKKQIYFFKYFS